jgi:chromosome segregation ATPase
MRRQVCAIAAGSLALSGCASDNTVGGGAAAGAAAGGLIGGAAGGDRGALIGLIAGGLIGAGVGAYVKSQKDKYASIEDRIAGERQLTLQATRTANQLVASSDAQLQALDLQLADLDNSRAEKTSKIQRANAMIADLTKQRGDLQQRSKELQTSIKNQKQFADYTEREAGDDTRKQRQVTSWRADIDNMQTALEALNGQITRVSAMQNQIQHAKAQYA